MKRKICFLEGIEMGISASGIWERALARFLNETIVPNTRNERIIIAYAFLKLRRSLFITTFLLQDILLEKFKFGTSNWGKAKPFLEDRMGTVIKFNRWSFWTTDS